MQTTDNPNKKVMIAAKVDPAIRRAIEQIADTEDRSVSKVIERVLKVGLEGKRLKRTVETA